MKQTLRFSALALALALTAACGDKPAPAPTGGDFDPAHPPVDCYTLKNQTEVNKCLVHEQRH